MYNYFQILGFHENSVSQLTWFDCVGMFQYNKAIYIT